MRSFMKISRLYLKIYFYFLAILFLVCFIIIPLIFFLSVDKPYKNLLQKRMGLFVSLMKTSLFKEDLPSAINDIARQAGADVAVYGEGGEVILTSGKHIEPLQSDLMGKVKNTGFYSDITKKRLFFLTTVDKPPYAYMSVSAEAVDVRERRSKFFFWLLVLCVIVSVLVYPLSMTITKPLEKITKKAMQFSRGDFTVFEKKEGKRKSSDEISRLDEAFTHMSGELLRMIEAKKELLSDISHEMGSPLSRMKVSIELIEDKVKESKIPSSEVILALSSDIDDMAKLVKELLDFSKMDLKGYTLDIKQCNLEELVKLCVKSFEPLTGRNNISIEIKKEGDLQNVSIDEEKIARVLQNLLSNAIKYSPQNGVIEVLLKGEKEHFFVSVKDDGPGIGKENGEKIFFVFFREDPSRTRGTGGACLGLAMARKIIELHGGRIWVENPGEKGAIITFKI